MAKGTDGNATMLPTVREDRIVHDIDRKLSEVIQKNIPCPNCGLPTHLDQDGMTAHCTTCSEYFDIVRNGPEGPRLGRPSKKTPKLTMVAAILAILIPVILIGSFTMAYFLLGDDVHYVDIDEINDIRELPRSDEINRSSISPDELDERIRESFDSEQRDEVKELEWIYKSLFIIPASLDLVSIAENESSGDGIAGFYDTETEEMYIVGENHSPEYTNYILAHEYTHALQDQNFDLDSYMQTNGYDADFSRLCAIEGDAVLTMEKWADDNLNELDRLSIQLEGLAQVLSTLDFQGGYSNEALSEMAYFPYEGGYEFVQKVYDAGGYGSVNLLFTTKPPLSSEHVLHYEKYVEYEEPMEVVFDPNGFDLTLQYSTTVGEKLLSEMLYLNGGTSDFGTSGALGWGGDRMYKYSSEGGSVSILVTRWDSNGYNDDFSASYMDMLDNLGVERNGIYEVDGSHVFVESAGDMTTIYIGSSEDLVRDLMG